MVTYFASGSNRAADIRGFQAVGHTIGVAAPELSPAAVGALLATTVPVFVDSGAFSEVKFTAAGVVHRPRARENRSHRVRAPRAAPLIGRAHILSGREGPDVSCAQCRRVYRLPELAPK